METPLCSSVFKTALLIVPLVLCFRSSTVVKAGDSDLLPADAVRPGKLDDLTESAQGYLKVYSATEKFNDSGVAYYTHSSYAIYTIDGEPFKSVKNHSSRSDENPALVAVPAGSYLVIARSSRHGSVRIPVVIKAHYLMVLDLDLREGVDRRLASRKSSRLAGQLSGSRVQVRRDFSILRKLA